MTLSSGDRHLWRWCRFQIRARSNTRESTHAALQCCRRQAEHTRSAPWTPEYSECSFRHRFAALVCLGTRVFILFSPVSRGVSVGRRGVGRPSACWRYPVNTCVIFYILCHIPVYVLNSYRAGPIFSLVFSFGPQIPPWTWTKIWKTSWVTWVSWYCTLRRRCKRLCLGT